MKIGSLVGNLLVFGALVILGRAGLGAEPSTATGTAGAKGASAGVFGKEVLPFLSKHCYACHGNGKSKGDLTLDQYRDEPSVERARKVWENVVEMVSSGEMPPSERPRPTVEESERVLKGIDAVLNKLDCESPRNPGRVTLRRLNRSEYNNTIRDLVGVDFKPAADFPNDDVGYGFDNIGDVLSLSPLLFEKYLNAAEAILDQAIVIDETPKPMLVQLGGLRPTMGAAVERRGSGSYLNKIGSFRTETYFDEGDYTFRIKVSAQQAGDQPVHAIFRLNGADIREFDVTGDRSDPTTIEAKLRLKGATTKIAVTFLNPYTDPDPDPEADDRDKAERRLYMPKIEVDGPYNAPPPVLPESHRRIMAHQADVPPREAAREIITRFTGRAFRRAVKAAEVDRFLALYDRAETEGARFEDRIRLALQGVLISPAFLFRVELDPPGVKPGEAYAVGEYELASRLSYFLWSSMPDDELLDLAARGRLRAELDAQVRRMLKDPKSAAFVENFAGQWLTLRKLDYVTPDRKEFPGFDDELKAAMYRETELFFDSILREDRSILDFLDADYSFVNGRLARHYGIEGVTGKEFRRVKLPPNRGGILTHASILTLTSNPTRTSPVKRGKWVLEQILNTPPPPPPPDVPDLAEEKRLTGSLREVMEQHRANPACASCHQRMDPIGFAFENYDAVGAWRDKDGAFPIDPSGTLPDGRSFRGASELTRVLREKQSLFRRTLAENVLTYAVGRGLEYYDKCAVDAIVGALESQGDRFSVLMAEVVRSEPFQKRTATGDQP